MKLQVAAKRKRILQQNEKSLFYTPFSDVVSERLKSGTLTGYTAFAFGWFII